jgi:hypothetical protein
MIGIHGFVEEGHSGHGPDDIDQRTHDVGIPALAEIWHAFDDLIHSRSSSIVTSIKQGAFPAWIWQQKSRRLIITPPALYA